MKRVVKNAIVADIRSVKIVKIYTKKGDCGKTHLFGGKEVFKFNSLVEGCGTIDELSSIIGVSISLLGDKKDRQILSSIQKDLYYTMAFISGNKKPIVFLLQKINFVEQYIDKVFFKLPKLNGFLLAQGGVVSSQLHLTRAVCRRAERRIVSLLQEKNLQPNLNKKSLLITIKYLNRLSDLFFIMARKHSSQETLVKSNCK